MCVLEREREREREGRERERDCVCVFYKSTKTVVGALPISP